MGDGARCRLAGAGGPDAFRAWPAGGSRLEGRHCSGCSDSPTADVLTVSAIKPTSGTVAGAAMSASNAWVRAPPPTTPEASISGRRPPKKSARTCQQGMPGEGERESCTIRVRACALPTKAATSSRFTLQLRRLLARWEAADRATTLTQAPRLRSRLNTIPSHAISMGKHVVSPTTNPTDCGRFRASFSVQRSKGEGKGEGSCCRVFRSNTTFASRDAAQLFAVTQGWLQTCMPNPPSR